MGKGPEKPKDPPPPAPPVRAGDPSTVGGDSSASKLSKRKERARTGFKSTILANRPPELQVSPTAKPQGQAKAPSFQDNLGGLLKNHFKIGL